MTRQQLIAKLTAIQGAPEHGAVEACDLRSLVPDILRHLRPAETATGYAPDLDIAVQGRQTTLADLETP
jgi:hypothetical protein